MLTIIAAVFAQAGPASSADAGCILNALTSAERQGITAPLLSGGAPAPALRERLDAVRDGCAEAGDWPPSRGRSAMALASGRLLTSAASGALRERGIDPVAIDAWFARQDDAVKTSSQVQQDNAERLILHLADNGVPVETAQAGASAIGVYLVGLVMTERARRGLGTRD